VTTLERTIEILIENELVYCFEEFSEKWAKKNKTWLAYTRCKGHDYSTDAAFNVLKETRKRKSNLITAHARLGAIVEDGIQALATVELLLKDFLYKKHKLLDCIFSD
jgi:hypothetical protein